MKKELPKEIRDKNEMLQDQIIRDLDDLIVNIMMVAIPKEVSVKNGEVKVVYAKEIQQKIAKIEKVRDDYIRQNYGKNT